MATSNLTRILCGPNRRAVSIIESRHSDSIRMETLPHVQRADLARAAKVEREAPIAVVEAVKSGAVPRNMAYQVAELPKEDQAIVAAAEPWEIKEVAKEEMM